MDDAMDPAMARRLGRSLVELVDSARYRVAEDDPGLLVTRITEHLGCGVDAIPSVSTAFDSWELVNLHQAVQAYLEWHSPHAEWFGVSGPGHGMDDLMDMLALARHHGAFALAAASHATAATGPDTAEDVVSFGLVRTQSPGGQPVVLHLRGPHEHDPNSGCLLRVLAADRDTATEVRGEIERLAAERNMFAGQLLQFDVAETRGNRLVSFLRRPQLSATDVVLPDGVLDTIERHVVRTAEHSARLVARGQHLKRGVLLYGPPGSGKTHTVRYLMGRLTGATVAVLSGRALTRTLPAAVSLARRWQPSVVVIEDVDLIAEDHSYTQGATPVLFELLNRIDGVDSDADITFLLTTNRVETVERTLVERPGRIDLAVEIPKPDAAGRERLLRLYTADTDLDLSEMGELVEATEGVTASFIRKLVRRAVLAEFEQEASSARGQLDGTALHRADELHDQSHALTRSLLGSDT